MQFRLPSAFLIFIGSYLPLAIILAIQDIPKLWWDRPICTATAFSAGDCAFVPFKNPSPSILFLTATIISVLLANLAFKKISFPFSIEIKEVKGIPNEIINYTFPYVVSFMGLSYNESEKLLGFAVFLLWMFAITYKSGQIIMNPLLLMFGWRLHDAKIIINNQSRDVRILKRGALLPGHQRAQTIQDFYIARD